MVLTLAIQSRMASRFQGQLQAGFDAGALGLTNDGMIEVRDPSKLALKDRVAITQAVAAYPAASHIKVEDGPGRPLGRSFRVKLWPTLVVLQDGKEVARVVRPLDAAEVREALAKAGAA